MDARDVTLPAYVMITPARNEADHIGRTLEAMVRQTRKPLRWVIVSDGSTDGTDEIVSKYLQANPWIELVRRPPGAERTFAAKVHAFNAGHERVRNLPYEIIGNLDGDVEFGPDYMEFLLGRFAAMPELGVAGTHYTEGEFHSFGDSYISEAHVNGQCQLFRRECFEDIGGYVPIKGGGIDWVAVTTARMKGWTTRSFAERTFEHLRTMGTASTGVMGARFHYGKKDYFLGGHPLWQLFRGTFQMAKKPYVVGGLALMSGYAWCWLRREPRAVSAELMRFHRGEQLRRMRGLLSRASRSPSRA